MFYFQHKKLILFVLVCIVLSFSNSISAQKYKFESPLDIPIYLSGSYGDLRLNHFHTGYDIRTQTKIGKNVYATADGFISRIKIEPSGYGKAIYIEHPNGLTSVYAHLEGFVDPIEQVVKNEQYRQSSFSIDFTPSSKIKVAKGELIAFSGNTGGSGGPHLHFEIRKTKSQNPINPYPFKFKLMDRFTNKFDDLYIYPLEGATVNNYATPLKFDIKPLKGKRWAVKLKKPIIVNGAVGIGIDAGSKSSSGFNHGLTKIEMTVNGLRVYSFNLDEFSYAQTRFANSVSDYAERLRTGNRIYKLYADQCNTLDAVSSVNNGIIRFTDTISLAKVKISTTDFMGNKAELSFSMRSRKASDKVVKTKKNNIKRKDNIKAISCNENYTLKNDSFKLFIPKGSLYDSIPANYSVSNALPNTLTPVYNFDNEYIPVHYSFNVKIKIPQEVLQNKSKLQIVNVWEKGVLTSLGGTVNDSWIETNSRNFGSFAIAIDTVAPTIKPVSLAYTSDMSFEDLIVFIIQDNLSGIDIVNGIIDGNWVLFEYDPKTRRIFYRFDPIRLKYGKKHDLKLNITDKCGNVATFDAEFFK
jgi:hypothetical protein